MKRFFKKTVLALLMSFLFYSCKAYYVGETTKEINLLSRKDTTSITRSIPVGIKVLTQKKDKDYTYVIYGEYKGYVYKPYFNNYHQYNSSVDGKLNNSSKKNIGLKRTRKTSTITSYSNSSGTVNVKGYYRKNGTYVRSHTRSSSGSYRRR